MERIYFDHCASTAISKSVQQRVNETQEHLWANPSGIYYEGQAAKNFLTAIRQDLGEIFKIKRDNIHFTSGATESNNLAIIGLALARQTISKRIILGPSEHSSIVEAAKFLEKHFGFLIEVLSCDDFAVADLTLAAQSITPDCALVALSFACSEIGSLQPVQEIAKLCQEMAVPLHLDAVQALGFFDLANIPYSTMALSAHKCYGPRGVGLLLRRAEFKLEPVLVGGGQEQGFRGGTENLSAISGLHQAYLEIIGADNSGTIQCCTYLKAQLEKHFPDIIHTGHPTERLPFHLSLIVPGIASTQLLIQLDLKGVSASIGSACNIGKNDLPAVLAGLKSLPPQPFAALRLSFGRSNSLNEIDSFITILTTILKSVNLAK